MIQWNKLTKEDDKTLALIAQRFLTLTEQPNQVPMMMEVMMDVGAAHLDTPMDLGRLLAADNFNFMHDLVGIRNHINRETGKLERCFLPRFAYVEKAADRDTVRRLKAYRRHRHGPERRGATAV